MSYVFKVGDRVAAKVDHIEKNQILMKGDTGTVCVVQAGTNFVGVCWDDSVVGHDCGGNCEFGYGWNVKTDDLMYCKDELTNIDIEVESGDLLALLGGVYES